MMIELVILQFCASAIV